MEKSIQKILQGYQEFRQKYVFGDTAIMQHLSDYGQKPQVMIVACCDSRVDPALILQCDPGDLFVVRNVANIVPPYEHDTGHHGTSAALEFGIKFLEIKKLILLGHTQCGGIRALVDSKRGIGGGANDFITDWVSLVEHDGGTLNPDEYAQQALHESHKNCLTFPWITERVAQEKLTIDLWFFDIQQGQVSTYCHQEGIYKPLESTSI